MHKIKKYYWKKYFKEIFPHFYIEINFENRIISQKCGKEQCIHNYRYIQTLAFYIYIIKISIDLLLLSIKDALLNVGLFDKPMD